MQKKITLSVNDEVWDVFHGYCEENDIMISKRIERLVSEHLKELNYKVGAKSRTLEGAKK